MVEAGDADAERPPSPVSHRRRTGTDVTLAASATHPLRVGTGESLLTEASATNAAFAQAEDRFHRETRGELIRNRRSALAAVLVGLLGAGAALVAVGSHPAKAVIPIAIALVAVIATIVAAYSRSFARGRRRPGRGGEDLAATAGVARIVEQLAAQRSAPRLHAASRAWLDG